MTLPRRSCCALLGLLLGACGAPAPPEMPNLPPEPIVPKFDASSKGNRIFAAARIAKELQDSPDKAAEILAKHEIDAARWESWMEEITSDPDANASFAKAMGETSPVAAEAPREAPVEAPQEAPAEAPQEVPSAPMEP